MASLIYCGAVFSLQDTAYFPVPHLIKVRIFDAYFKGQLTRTFCERLFCSSSNARIGVSERPSELVDSVIFLVVCGPLAAVEKTPSATSRLRPV